MIRKNINQSGFSVVEVLIIIVIIVILGAGGYIVWHNNHKKKTPVQKVSTTSNVQKSKSSNSSSTASKAATNTTKAPSTGVITANLGKAPQGLKTAVMNRLQAAGCLNSSGQVNSVGGGSIDPNILMIYYTNNGGAAFNGCDALSLFSYTNGQWQYDVSSQDVFTCTQLQKYNFPSAVLNTEASTSTTQCIGSGGGLATYSN